MIDLAATAALIQNLKNNGFTSAREKLIAIVLANVSQIQQCEIIEILDLDQRHCRDTLREFVEKKLLDSFGKRDIFYRPVASPSFSPLCGESAVNMLTSVNSTKQTNKKDSEISFETQAAALT